MADNALLEITQTIQLAVAPVFLLSAIGTTLAVLTTRLSRIIDRARELEGGFAAATEDQQGRTRAELAQLSRRARIVYLALTTSVGSALSVCLLIMVAFVGYLFQTNLGTGVAVLFIVALGLFVFALVNFLREIVLGLQSLSFGIQKVVKPPAAQS